MLHIFSRQILHIYQHGVCVLSECERENDVLVVVRE